MLEAFKQLYEANPDLNVKLLIVGDGPERERLMATVRATGISERVVFTGQVKNVQPVYAIADVFVLSSHSEGSPNVLLEAMAAQVPIVATAVGGVPEIVENEESALLVPANDPAALAAAIARVVKDNSLSQRLARKATALVETQFTSQNYARSLIEIYLDVISTQTRSRD